MTRFVNCPRRKVCRACGVEMGLYVPVCVCVRCVCVFCPICVGVVPNLFFRGVCRSLFISRRVQLPLLLVNEVEVFLDDSLDANTRGVYSKFCTSMRPTIKTYTTSVADPNCRTSTLREHSAEHVEHNQGLERQKLYQFPCPNYG